ncbi:uncharacterized protein A1O5_05061 [Cladophialophora psammophila CBS 110553]|uniref:Uncharacterized protein n=1 Tax=Cladophialophora psammophila CBS 110553 TaxID=1182543 RepID=W9X1P5_9EURO|nr:uncharacterized protein A1O5_05061 [Cladophialophora psammophila CBS 110553]EXJ71255.1 hypothetical protein A1O5_05061 [Cladophialophora psammophila CBS 110553]
MTAPKAFLFVDSFPARTDIRDKELLRAEALSHAAKASHRTDRQVDSTDFARRKKAFNVQISKKPPLQQQEQQEAVPTPWTKDPEGGENEPSPHPSRKGGGRSDAVQRWRLQSEKPLRQHSVRGTGKGSSPSKWSNTHCPASMEMTIPMHKGNSDPFNSTSIPFAAFDLSLVRDDRRCLVDIVWPAEICMRKNHLALLDRLWTVMPSILDSPAVVHAVISHAHYSKAMRYLTSGRRDQNALILAEHHKLRAVRNLQHLLEAYRQLGGLDLLNRSEVLHSSPPVVSYLEILALLRSISPA